MAKENLTAEQLAAKLLAITTESETNAKLAADASAKLQTAMEKIAALENELDVKNRVMDLVTAGTIDVKQASVYQEKLQKLAGNKDAMDMVTEFMTKEATAKKESPFDGFGPALNDGVPGTSTTPGARVGAALDQLSK